MSENAIFSWYYISTKNAHAIILSISITQLCGSRPEGSITLNRRRIVYFYPNLNQKVFTYYISSIVQWVLKLYGFHIALPTLFFDNTSILRFLHLAELKKIKILALWHLYNLPNLLIRQELFSWCNLYSLLKN